MSATPEPTPSPGSNPAPSAPSVRGRGISVGNILLLAIPAVLIAGAVYAYVYFTADQGVIPVDYARSIRQAVVNPEKLAEPFTDADGDLVADVPKDPAKQVDPDTLGFGTLEKDMKKAEAEWKEFLDHLRKVTGKKVELVDPPAGGRGTAEFLNAGKLHVASFSTGAVPLAVNTAGFVPCFVMADEQGKFGYQMEILVPAGSPVRSPADLKGKKVTLGSMSSLSSFKAPMVLLWKEHHFRPEVDYTVDLEVRQREAIGELFEGKREAVAVANDYLARVVRDNKLDREKVRSVYKSETYPPFCVGHVYNLKPELAAKVREAFKTFGWKGTGLEKAYRPANQTQFVEVSYKKEWEPVRKVDSAILGLVGGP